MVATDRDSDGSPKEHFDDHAAGLGGLAGHGGSSYIDSVIWRDKDANTAWNSAADSTMEQRHYYCQNWRADVSAVVNDDGSRQIESIKYFSYGYPVNIPAGDVNSDGVTDSSDTTEINKWRLATPVVYRVRADLNLDGVLDASDETLCSQLETTVGGRGVLSRSDTGNRKGYAGYESDATADAGGSRFWHVRHRVLDSSMGKWVTRDPAGYIDGVNLRNYVNDRPQLLIDSTGLRREPVSAEECVRRCASRRTPESLFQCLEECLGGSPSGLGGCIRFLSESPPDMPAFFDCIGQLFEPSPERPPIDRTPVDTDPSPPDPGTSCGGCTLHTLLCSAHATSVSIETPGCKLDAAAQDAILAAVRSQCDGQGTRNIDTCISTTNCSNQQCKGLGNTYYMGNMSQTSTITLQVGKCTYRVSLIQHIDVWNQDGNCSAG